MDTPENETIPAGLSLRFTLAGHTDNIHRISWSPSGDVLVSPSRDKTTRFWKDGQLIGMLKDSVGRSIAAAWAPDGEHIALVADNDVLRLWNVARGESERTRSGGLGQVTSVAWAPDNRVVATGSLKHGVRLWDAEFKNFRSLTKKNSEPIYCLAFSKRGPYLAAGTQSGAILIWNLDDDKESGSWPAHPGGVFSLHYSAANGQLASSGADGLIQLWDPMTGANECALKGHTAAVNSVSVSHDGRLLASKSADGTVRIWSLEIEETLAVLAESVGPTWLPGIDFHPAEAVLATLGANDRVIRVWDLDFASLLGDQGPGAF
jgi:WD40 repeat protein